MATKEFLSATKPLARSRAVVAVVVAVGVAVAVGVLSQQPGAQAQDATVAPTYTVKDLGTLGGPSSTAYGINDAGQVVGVSTTSHSVAHAFLYDRKASPKMQDLGTLGGNYSSASDINDAGQVVGYSDTTNCSVEGCYTDYHAFLCERSATPEMQDLGTLGVGNYSGFSRSSASSINDAGQVVGVSTTSSDSYHAFLHERSATPKMQDLNSLIRPDSGWSLEEARAINQRGQIVGLGERNGHNRAFLLTPRKKTLQSDAYLPKADLSEATGITAEELYQQIDSEIYAMDSDGSEEVNLTDDTAWDSDPSWFPSGDRIAYVSDRTTDGSGTEVDVYALQVGSSGDTQPVRITNTPSDQESDPVVSPDGEQIAFVRPDPFGGVSDIYVMRSEPQSPTNQPKRLTFFCTRQAFATAYVPNWSPDGKQIAFAGEGDIYVMNADGTDQTRITSNPAEDSYPAFSPNGKYIAFSSTRGNADGSSEHDIWKMKSDGSNPTQLTDDPAHDAWTNWQPLP